MSAVYLPVRRVPPGEHRFELPSSVDPRKAPKAPKGKFVKQEPAEVVASAAESGKVLLSRDGQLKVAGLVGNAVNAAGQFVGYAAQGLRNVAQHGPLPAAAVYGLLGAGVGYGSAKLVNKVTGKDTKLPALWALLGAGVGATPGLLHAAANRSLYGPENSNRTPFSPEFYQGFLDKHLGDFNTDGESITEKVASFFGRNPVPVSYTRGQVMADPYLDPIQKAQVITMLSKADPDGMGMAQPPTLAGAAMGAGLGFAAGTAFARIMSGVFGGLSNEAQTTLQNAGVVAGLLKGTGVLQ